MIYPKFLKKGDKKLVTTFEIPLTSKSSVKTNMLTKYGKMLTANGTADFAPCVNASYGLTFFITANKKMIKNKTGIKNLDIFVWGFNEYFY